jgi:hypothetical protein
VTDNGSADMCSLTAAARTFLESSGPTRYTVKPGGGRTAQFLASRALRTFQAAYRAAFWFFQVARVPSRSTLRPTSRWVEIILQSKFVAVMAVQSMLESALMSSTLANYRAAKGPIGHDLPWHDLALAAAVVLRRDLLARPAGGDGRGRRGGPRARRAVRPRDALPHARRHVDRVPGHVRRGRPERLPGRSVQLPSSSRLVGTPGPQGAFGG